MTPQAPAVFDPWGVDSVTLFVAILVAGILAGVRWYRSINPVLTRQRVISDFLNASVLYPFFLLIICVPHSVVFEYLKGSRLTVGLAGGVGIIYVLGELVRGASRKDPD
jgi:hypothetical protein